MAKKTVKKLHASSQDGQLKEGNICYMLQGSKVCSVVLVTHCNDNQTSIVSTHKRGKLTYMRVATASLFWSKIDLMRFRTDGVKGWLTVENLHSGDRLEANPVTYYPTEDASTTIHYKIDGDPNLHITSAFRCSVFDSERKALAHIAKRIPGIKAEVNAEITSLCARITEEREVLASVLDIEERCKKAKVRVPKRP